MGPVEKHAGTMTLVEPTTLASAIRVIADTLEADYQVAAAPLFQQAGLRINVPMLAGDRFPSAKVQRLWSLATEATRDPAFGLKVGRRIRPASMHALGFSWLACGTLREAMERLCRYYRLISTVIQDLELVNQGEFCVLEVRYLPGARIPDAAVDAFLMGVVTLCREAAGSGFDPAEVRLVRPALSDPAVYAAAFGAPVVTGAACHALVFAQRQLDRPLAVSNPDMLRATDSVAERYLEKLNPNAVATSVRRLLTQLLSSGKADQTEVARRLNMSSSTLQRQLRAEGTSFRAVLDGTRRGLAEVYLQEGDLSHAEIAYLLGFGDQSSFSRAYRRWAGTTPRAFRSGRTPG